MLSRVILVNLVSTCFDEDEETQVIAIRTILFTPSTLTTTETGANTTEKVYLIDWYAGGLM